MPANEYPQRTLNLIIGIITIIFLGLFATALVLTTRNDLADTQNDYFITAYFTNIGALQTGASVKFGGVKIGRVISIELEPDMNIKVECKISTSKNIPIDSKLTIAATTVSGDTYMNLILGTDTVMLEHTHDQANSPVLKGLNFISINGIGTVFNDMKDITTVLTNSFSRLFGKESKVIAEYKTTIDNLPKLTRSLEELKQEKSQLLTKVEKATNSFASLKEQADCCIGDLARDYPLNKINSGIGTISKATAELGATINSIQNTDRVSQIKADFSQLNTWAESLTIAKRSVLGILLSKGCGGLSQTIKLVGESVKTAQDFSLFKKLGFYFDGKRLLSNFEERTHAEYMPASIYMYRWSVFSYQRYMHNCDLPSGVKNCPQDLR